MKIREIITEYVELKEFFGPFKKPMIDQLVQTVEDNKNKLLNDMMNLEKEWKNQNVHHDTSQYPAPEVTEASTPSATLVQQYKSMREAAITLNAALGRLKALGALDRLQYPENIYRSVLANANKYARNFTGKTIFEQITQN